MRITSGSGHIPRKDSAIVATERVMIALVSGSAIRLVRMKYLGKVWKWYHARAPVKTCQEIDSIAALHIFRKGLNLDNLEPFGAG